MRGDQRHFNQFSKSAIGGLLIGMILLLDAMAACPALHELIHKDAHKAGHECAVTLIAHGKVSAAPAVIAAPLPVVLTEATRRCDTFLFSPSIENLPPGRAPPADSSAA